MKYLFRAGAKVAAALVALSAVSGPVMARDWQDRRYDDDRHYQHNRYPDDVRLHGPGVSRLDPWLRNAKGGRKFVVRVLGTNRVSRRDAWIVNRELAERHGDRGGWRDHGPRYSDRWR